jgi:hypothetical protein
MQPEVQQLVRLQSKPNTDASTSTGVLLEVSVVGREMYWEV